MKKNSFFFALRITCIIVSRCGRKCLFMGCRLEKPWRSYIHGVSMQRARWWRWRLGVEVSYEPKERFKYDDYQKENSHFL